MTFKAVIVDDDANGIQAIKNLVDQFSFPAEIVGSAQSIEEAIPILNKTKPDILFLDIEMNNESGFDLLEVWNNDETKVVFCTGYDQYAIKALKEGAYDYILKPLDYKEFTALFQKLEKEKSEKGFTSASNEDDTKLIVKSPGGMHIIDYCDINYLKADGRYTEINYNSGKTCLSSKNLGQYEDEIQIDCFVRINKSMIINHKNLRGVEKRGNQSVIIFENTELEISDGIRKSLIKMMD